MAEELLASAAALREIIEAAPSALIVTSGDGVILLANRQAEALFKYGAGELIGQPIEVLVPTRFAAGHPAVRASFHDDPRARPMGAGRDLHGRRRDGSEVPIEIGLNPLHTEHGRLVLAAVVDLSERKALEGELRVRLDELARVDRQKNEFLAMLGHELRNPLAPMRSAIHVLNSARAPPDVQRNAREMLERQMEHLVRLVDDLLDVARIIGGRIELRREIIDLNEAVKRGLETAQHLIDAHGHRVVLAVAAEPLRIRGDLVRLAQVVTNLLTNAARYSPAAGRIWVSTEAEAAVGVIRVRDEGSGITPDLLPRVFDLFVQADTGLARTQGGLGIGLTLAQRLVSLHGGTIDAASAGAGRGAEFSVRIPLCDVDESANEGVEPSEPMSSGRRVLVVDDNVDAAESIAAVLRLAGCTVATAYEGHGALRAATEQCPDVILLDIGLPDISGYEVARRLRAIPAFARTPLVAVTGYGQEDDRRKSHEAGIDFHLTKPVDIDVLHGLIASA